MGIFNNGIIKSVTVMAAMFLSQPLMAATYYVDGGNWSGVASDGNTGLSGRPFKTLNKGISKLVAGDTLIIEPSQTYTGFIWIDKNGTRDKYITIKGRSKSNRPKLRGEDNPEKEVMQIKWSSYLKIENLDIQGHTNSPKNGVQIAESHHIEFNDNYVHDSKGGGVGTHWSDYIKIQRNIVANNAHWMKEHCGSGIMLYQMDDIDSNYGTKNEVRDNIVYGNTNSYGYHECNHSDGNGIIVDDSRNTQRKSTKGAYRGGFLIENNIIYKNGGRAIHVYKSDNVTARNNSSYYNNQDRAATYYRGEYSAVTSNNIKYYNNIAYTDGYYGKNFAFEFVDVYSGKTNIVRYNLVYESGNTSTAANSATYTFQKNSVWPDIQQNKQGQPNYVNASVGDLKVYKGSPALYTGYGYGNAADVDITGAFRSSSKPSIGAHEHGR